MFKKILIFSFLFLLLNSCSQEKKVNINKNTDNKITCKNSYKILEKNKTNLNLKWVIIESDQKNITSKISWNITYLNCVPWKKVYPKTLIVKISPDYNNPNIKNLKTQLIDLKTQKLNLLSQIANIKSNKISTSNSFDIQIKSVDNNIESLKSQIEILKKNIENTKNTWKINSSDLDSQIKSLESQIEILKENIKNTKNTWKVNNLDLDSQIKSLQDSLVKLENSKKIIENSLKNELEKLETSKKNLLITIKNTIKDNLKIIDEVYWITKENKDLNDKFQDYLSAKNISYKREVEKKFFQLNQKINSFDKMSDLEISDYLKNIIYLDNLAWKWVNSSIDNVYFPQTKIDSFYNRFLSYSNNLANLKTNFDNFPESKKVLKTNFENQLNSIDNQIETSKNNLENLKKNKKSSIWINTNIQVLNMISQLKTMETNLENLKKNKKSSIWVNTDIQIWNLNSQLKWLESNLQNLYSNKKNLIENKKTSLSSLDNQIIQLENNITWLNSNIKIINTNLSPNLLYAEGTWVVKQKLASKWNIVWPNTPICQIIPSKKSQKIKIYSPIELNIWDKLTFEFKGNPYEIIIENALVYKDSATQNYVYESNYLDKNYFKSWEIVSLKFEESPISVSPKGREAKQNDKIIKIPVSYIKNRIEWNFVKVLSWSQVIEKKVELWDINWDYIEIKNWINWVNKICK